MLKKLFLSGVAALALASAATAQVNYVPQVGVSSEYLRKTTYSAAFFGLVPAASATDILCISGSSTKTIRLQTIKITGTATTLVTTPVAIRALASLDTAGTAGTTTANPANTVAKRIPADPTASAVLVSYTANPTVNDASPTYIDAQYLTFGVSGTNVTNPLPSTFEFGLYSEDLLREPTIPIGSTRQLCVNLGGVTISAGSIAGSITWTEE
jgi:hypothetical protein